MEGNIPGAPLMKSAGTGSFRGTVVAISDGCCSATCTPVWGAEVLSQRAIFKKREDTPREAGSLCIERRRDMTVMEQEGENTVRTEKASPFWAVYSSRLTCLLTTHPSRCLRLSPRFHDSLAYLRPQKHLIPICAPRHSFTSPHSFVFHKASLKSVLVCSRVSPSHFEVFSPPSINHCYISLSI